jgi:hypothetical protein
MTEMPAGPSMPAGDLALALYDTAHDIDQLTRALKRAHAGATR